MKKIFISISLLSICFISCSEPNVPVQKTKYIVKEGGNHVEIVIIDGCEYLYGPWGNATVLTHKGNCKNHNK